MDKKYQMQTKMDNKTYAVPDGIQVKYLWDHDFTLSHNLIHDNMIPLGYSLTNEEAGIGFHAAKGRSKKSLLITDNSEAHLITIAPTGAGKGRSLINPTCLSYPGSLVVFDTKAEAYFVTADARRKLGPVILIDPFKISGNESHSFNPFSLYNEGQPVEQQGIMIAKAFQNENYKFSSDPFWDQKAFELISALCIHELASGERSFRNLRKTLFSDDVDYAIAVLLDTKKDMNPLARELFAAYLQTPSDKTRPSILSTAHQHLSILGDPAVLNVLEGNSSLDIKQLLLANKPVTIYFVMPANKLSAYAMLTRLWMVTLLNLLTDKIGRSQIPTLMIVDEAANLGRMDAIVSAITLLRAYGIRLWLFFQDLGQMKHHYPAEWTTLLNNCAIQTYFGIRTHLMAKEIAEVSGVFTAAQLLNLPADQSLLCRHGGNVQKIKKLDYLTDGLFKKKGFKPNPYYYNNGGRSV